MTAQIIEVDLKGDRDKAVRRILGRSIRRAVRDGDLAGFALVTWDARGECNSAYYTETGPISRSMIPAYTADALNRHIAVSLVEETTSERIGGD